MRYKYTAGVLGHGGVACDWVVAHETGGFNAGSAVPRAARVRAVAGSDHLATT